MLARLFVVTLALVGGSLMAGGERIGSHSPIAAPQPRPEPTPIAEAATPAEPLRHVERKTTKHPVTPWMKKSSSKQRRKPAPSFSARAHDGKTYRLDDTPTLLVFIKPDCPCSETAQPFFNRIAIAYQKVRVLGVINADAKTAALWAKKHEAGFPILCDPNEQIIRACKAENSAYSALIVEKRIERLWPGFSTSMLTRLGEKLAGLTGSEVRTLALEDAPFQMYSGCPYEWVWDK